MNVKDHIDQRLRDLAGRTDKDATGQFIEAYAAKLVIEDLQQAADIAVLITPSKAATIAEVLSINQLVQAYVGPAYQQLVTRGILPPPAVPTNNSAAVKTKDEWDS